MSLLLNDIYFEFSDGSKTWRPGEYSLSISLRSRSKKNNGIGPPLFGGACTPPCGIILAAEPQFYPACVCDAVLEGDEGRAEGGSKIGGETSYRGSPIISMGEDIGGGVSADFRPFWGHPKPLPLRGRFGPISLYRCYSYSSIWEIQDPKAY